MIYDSTGCAPCGGGSKPKKIIYDQGKIYFAYQNNTGLLMQITSNQQYSDGNQQSALNFTYDGSLPTSVAWTGEVSGNTNVFAYLYDLSGRLWKVERNDTLISEYLYDDNGNRISYISQGSTVAGAYDAQDRMLSYGSSTFGYNARGSLTFKAENGDTTFYNYDMLGNLISVKLPNRDFIEYLIDAQNRRVGKKVNGVVEKQWIYQDQLNPVAEFDGNNNLISRFVYGDKGHPEGSGQVVPAYMVKDSIVYRYVTDHLGSVRLVVNTQTGEIAQKIAYNEFGNVLLNTAPDFQPFAYAGGLVDVQTKLVRFGARDYDAEVGRWTAKDPIGFGGGQGNLYVYVYSNQINSIDPIGLGDIYNSTGNAFLVFAPPQDGNPADMTVLENYSYVLSTDTDWDFYQNSAGEWVKVPNNSEVLIQYENEYSLPLILEDMSFQQFWLNVLIGAINTFTDKDINVRYAKDRDGDIEWLLKHIEEFKKNNPEKYKELMELLERINSICYID